MFCLFLGGCLAAVVVFLYVKERRISLLVFGLLFSAAFTALCLLDRNKLMTTEWGGISMRALFGIYAIFLPQIFFKSFSPSSSGSPERVNWQTQALALAVGGGFILWAMIGGVTLYWS